MMRYMLKAEIRVDAHVCRDGEIHEEIDVTIGQYVAEELVLPVAGDYILVKIPESYTCVWLDNEGLRRIGLRGKVVRREFHYWASSLGDGREVCITLAVQQEAI